MQENFEHYMNLALKLAKKGLGNASPNPMVGAVLVKNNKIIGLGYHKKAGLPHGEIEAINSAESSASGSTLYVNLEPCNNFGKTPPCTDRIIKEKISRVVIAMQDPNPINKGKGIKELKKAGTKIKLGVLEKKARELNRVFIKYMAKRLPFITLKLAESLDGKIATNTGDSKWITSLDARQYVHKLRSQYDGCMVGINTVLKDNPTLLNKLYKKQSTRQPARIIVGNFKKIPKSSNIFKYTNISKVFIASSKLIPASESGRLRKNNIEYLYFKSRDGRIPLKNLLRKLAADFEISSVLVEGGSELAASLLKDGLVDKVLFFISPRIIGGKDATTAVGGSGINSIKDSILLKDVKITKFKNDFLIEGSVK